MSEREDRKLGMDRTSRVATLNGVAAGTGELAGSLLPGL
jgi:hypothetical protein